MRKRHTFYAVSALVALGAIATVGLRSAKVGFPPAPPAASAAAPPSSKARGESPAEQARDDERDFVFRIPSGEPTALSCEDARRVVGQVRDTLAYVPEPLKAQALAESATDWLDPHAMWALASDAPTGRSLEQNAAPIVRELEQRSALGCPSAERVGAVLATWVDQLRRAFDAARASAKEGDAPPDWRDAAATPVPSSGPALAAATELGRRAGLVERGLGEASQAYVTAARDRFFPSMPAAAWGRVVLAASVRAYVPLVDPHGAWAPFDEEASVYEVELSTRPPSRLWTKAVPTAIGVLVDQGGRAPLHDGDVVVSLGGVSTAGLPLEQVDQLAFATADARVPTEALVLRKGSAELVHVKLASEERPPVDVEPAIKIDHVAYGDRQLVVATFHDVRDDLGDELARALAAEKNAAGLLLDLRGNGGGSTDGAIAALGLFLPGKALFPMKRRDGSVTVDRAPEPAEQDRWNAPVATLVDGATASAAEMIAGALAVYKRGPSVGTPTYGKGCAQEYVDDDARTGVLRLTTLLFSLPDGSPLQRVGITPTLAVPLASTGPEREATVSHAPPSWRGPDVREPMDLQASAIEWPAHGGKIGPCDDAEVCRAVRALGPGSATKRGPSARAH